MGEPALITNHAIESKEGEGMTQSEIKVILQQFQHLAQSISASVGKHPHESS
jgi:hypothetical protein